MPFVLNVSFGVRDDMPSQSILEKMFSEFGGLDLRSHDAERQPRFAKSVRNIEFTPANGITSRKGHKGRIYSAGGGGTKKFVYLNTTTGARSEELITIDQNLFRRKAGSISITYSGANSNVTVSIIPVLTGSTYSFSCIIVDGGTTVLNQDLGTGIEEASPYTVGSLVTAINALASFNCTASGTTTGPAAFLPMTQDSAASGLTIAFDYWEQIYCPTTNPFSTFYATFNDEGFEIANLFEHANRFFIATGFNELYKYDSVSAYRAGMPAATTLASVITAGGALVQPDNYDSFITYEQIDALGNVVEGDGGNITSVTSSVGNQQITHTIPNILAASGFLTSCAVKVGLETDTTIDVDDGAGGAHTLQVGQTAFFRDNGGVLREELITAVTANTITIANSRTIADNEVISANLRINLWRNRSGSTEIFYLVRTFANNSFTASQTYIDNIADASLLVEWEEPIEGHGLPPANLRYLTSYQNILVGSDRNSDEIDFSDTDGPEYWNSSFVIRSKSNEPVSGLGANREILLVGKTNESHIVQGDLPNSRYRQELLADAIGPASHHSIIDVESTLWFMSKDHGVMRIVSTSTPEDLSYRIFPTLSERAVSSDREFVFERCIAVNVPKKHLVLFFLPTESIQGGYYLPNESSIVLVGEYRSQFEVVSDYDEQGRVQKQIPNIRWLQWDNINMAGGATVFDDKLVWSERYYNDAATAFQAPLVEEQATNTEYDYHDHGLPIGGEENGWEYEASWVDLNEPDILKKFVEASIMSFEDGILGGAFTITAETNVRWINGLPHSRKTIVFGEAGVSSGWGFWSWGEAPWGDVTTTKKFFPFLPTKSVAIKLIFRSTVYLTRPLISAWTIEAKPVFGSTLAGIE